MRLAYRDIIVEEKLENKASWDDEKPDKTSARWLNLAKEMYDGSVVVRLVTSRVKIASMKKITTPLSELVAAQISSRLKTWLLDTLDIQMGVVIHLVDSSIVLGMIKNIALKFDSFVAPRISEIQSNVGDAEWYWLESKDNPSDLGTRGNVTPKILILEQCGKLDPNGWKRIKQNGQLERIFENKNFQASRKNFKFSTIFRIFPV